MIVDADPVFEARNRQRRQCPSAETSAIVALATCNGSSTVNTPGAADTADARDKRGTAGNRMWLTLHIDGNQFVR